MPVAFTTSAGLLSALHRNHPKRRCDLYEIASGLRHSGAKQQRFRSEGHLALCSSSLDRDLCFQSESILFICFACPFHSAFSRSRGWTFFIGFVMCVLHFNPAKLRFEGMRVLSQLTPFFSCQRSTFATT
jgi:hypothetical protein